MMKNLIPFITLFIFTSCSEPEIPSHRLVENGGIFYELDSNKPFSGSSITFKDSFLFSKTYLQNGTILKKETFYKSGKIHIRETFLDDKKVGIVTIFDETGKDISNETFQVLWENGLIKITGKYFLGKKEGLWEEFDISGNSVTRTYWSNGLKIPIIEEYQITVRDNVPYLINSNEPFSGIIKFQESDYLGVVLQEFKEGKPDGIYESRYKQDEGGGLSCYTNRQVGKSFNFEFNQIDSDDLIFVWEDVLYLCYFEDGTLSFNSTTNNDKETYINYYPNGKINWKGFNIRGLDDSPLKDKELLVYHENGQIKSKLFYDKGTLISGKRFDETGKDISNGEGLGTEDFYGESRGYFSNGLKEGIWELGEGIFTTYKQNLKEGPSCESYYGCGVYKSDKREGQWEHENYGVKYFENGLKEGLTVEKISKNCTNSVGSYKNDQKSGNWTKYKYCKEDGDPYETIFYLEGKVFDLMGTLEQVTK